MRSADCGSSIKASKRGHLLNVRVALDTAIMRNKVRTQDSDVFESTAVLRPTREARATATRDQREKKGRNVLWIGEAETRFWDLRARYDPIAQSSKVRIA